jgi:hypothetical protein
MCSEDLNMGTISGTAHIKTIFIVTPGSGKHFIGNELCNSDGAADTELVRICTLVQ